MEICDKCGRRVSFTVKVNASDSDLRVQSWCVLDVLRYGFADVLGVEPSTIDNKVKESMALTPAKIQALIDKSLIGVKQEPEINSS